jgi:hypothetical protein
MLNRKLFAALILIAACLFTFAGPAYAAPVDTHATQQATQGNVKPNFSATGGGCQTSTDNFSSGNSVKVEACISGAGSLINWDVYPDEYLTFSTQSPSLWSSCTNQLELIDVTHNILVSGTTINCLSWAQEGGTWYGNLPAFTTGACPDQYWTYSTMSGYYNGIYVNTHTYSPIEYINC